MGTPLYSTDIIPLTSRPTLTVMDDGDYFVIFDTSTGKISKILKTLAMEALNISYDNTASELTAETVQAALDELVVNLGSSDSAILALSGRLDTLKGTGWAGQTVKGNADDIGDLQNDKLDKIPEAGASIGTAQNPYSKGYFENVVVNNEIDVDLVDAEQVVADAINLGTPSLSSNGYSLLPNGMLMQWVSLSIGKDTTSLNVTFPIAFSSRCVFATIVSNWHGSSGSGWDYVRNISTTGCTCVTQTGNPRLLAIGY